MDGHRSRSQSQSSSSSTRSWSLIENPELEVRDAAEIADLQSDSEVTDCNCDECTAVNDGGDDYADGKKQTYFNKRISTSAYDSDDDDDDESMLDDSVELLSDSCMEDDVDICKIRQQFDLLSECKESPAERFIRSIFTLDSSLKISSLASLVTLSLITALLLKYAGVGRDYVPHMNLSDSVCVLDKEQILGLQYREYRSAFMGPSIEEPLRPFLLWPPSPSISHGPPPPSMHQKDHVKDHFSIAKYVHSHLPTNQCLEGEYKRRDTATNEAVQRYTKHMKLREKIRQTLKPDNSSVDNKQKEYSKINSSFPSDNNVNNRTNKSWCSRCSIPIFNSSAAKKSQEIFGKLINKKLWKNVTSSLFRFPKMAKKFIGANLLVSVVGKSKLGLKFKKAFSSVKTTIGRGIAKVKVQRDKFIRIVSTWKKSTKTTNSGSKVFETSTDSGAAICPSSLSMPIEEERCFPNNSCDSLVALGAALQSSTRLFASFAGENNADLVKAENDYYSSVSNRCDLNEWQNSFDMQGFIALEGGLMTQPFTALGWPIQQSFSPIKQRRKVPRIEKAIEQQKATFVKQSDLKNDWDWESIFHLETANGWTFRRSTHRAFQRAKGAH